MHYDRTNTLYIAALKRCEAVYKYVFYFYAGLCGVYALASLIFGILGLGNVYIIIVDGIILKLIVAALGILGCYNKNDKLCVLAPVVVLFGLFCNDHFVNGALLVGSIACAVISIITNRKYHELEKIEGFPYFNERFNEENEKFRSGKDVYQEQYEKLKSRNLSDTMDEL